MADMKAKPETTDTEADYRKIPMYLPSRKNFWSTSITAKAAHYVLALNTTSYGLGMMADPAAEVAYRLRCSREDAETALRELQDAKLMMLDADAGVYWLYDIFTDPGNNANHQKKIRSTLKAFPASHVVDACCESHGFPSEWHPHAVATASECHRNHQTRPDDSQPDQTTADVDGHQSRQEQDRTLRDETARDLATDGPSSTGSTQQDFAENTGPTDRTGESPSGVPTARAALAEKGARSTASTSAAHDSSEERAASHGSKPATTGESNAERCDRANQGQAVSTSGIPAAGERRGTYRTKAGRELPAFNLGTDEPTTFPFFDIESQRVFASRAELDLYFDPFAGEAALELERRAILAGLECDDTDDDRSL